MFDKIGEFMDYETIIFESNEQIGKIIINRPGAMNALNTQFFMDMQSLLDQLIKMEDVKIVVITGEGKAFAAGADIAEMVNLKQAEAKEFSFRGQNLFSRIEQFEKPIIAAVNGFALGGGCELAMACDIRYASTNAKFGQPEVNLGLVPGYAATQRLPGLVGVGNALDLLLTGDLITAQEAHRIGLVQRLFEPEELMDAVIKIAGSIISKGPSATKKVKYLTRLSRDLSFEAGSAKETELFASLFENEGAEGMKAFLEKRKPNW